MKIKLPNLVMAIGVLGTLLITPIHDGWGGNVKQTLTQQDAIRLKRAGKILPLNRVLEIIRQKFSGTVIEVELEGESDEGEDIAPNLIYEIKLLDPYGQRIDIEINARTGTITSRKGGADDTEDDELRPRNNERKLLP